MLSRSFVVYPAHRKRRTPKHGLYFRAIDFRPLHWRHSGNGYGRCRRGSSHRDGDRRVGGGLAKHQYGDQIRKLTDAMVSIEGEAMREVTWVVVEEVKSGSWGIGGKALTTGDIKAMTGGG